MTRIILLYDQYRAEIIGILWPMELAGPYSYKAMELAGPGVASYQGVMYPIRGHDHAMRTV